MLHIIINPVAGNGHAETVGREIVQALEERRIEHTAFRTEYAGHGVELARQAAEIGVDTVVSVGGDGTILEIVQGIAGTQTALGIIPAGTGNDVIKALDAPSKPMEALEFMLSHPARPLDAGKINDTLFLNVAGTGIDVVVLDYAESAKRYVRGILPYFWGVIRAIIAYKPVQVTVQVDGDGPHTHQALLVAVGNGRYIGGGMNVAPDATPDDGLFDLLVIDNLPKWRLPFHLPKLLNGKIRQVPNTLYCKCKSVKITSPGMRVNIDGSIVPMKEAQLDILPGALKAHW